MSDELNKSDVDQNKDFEKIRNPQVDVRIQLDSSQMRLDELAKINAGEIVLLDQTVENDLSILMGNKIIGYGSLVTVNGRYAMRVKRVIGG